MPVKSVMSYLRHPSSHAFIDLNNDLVPDLWITSSEGFEVWLRMGSEYVFHKTILPPPDVIVIGQTSFADVN